MVSGTSHDALAAMDVAGRLGRLVALLDDHRCDALVVTKRENVRYLTGFSGSAGTLVVSAFGATLVTDGRYEEQAAHELGAHQVNAAVEIAHGKKALESLLASVAKAPRVGLEADDCSWSFARRIANEFGDDRLVATSGVVEQLRTVKDEGELARIEAACHIADSALGQVRGRLGERPTESQFAAELEFEMRQRGSTAPAFATIVASGPNSAMPHARPTDRVIEEGDLVVVDFGATVDGYRSDMTRTYGVGALDPALIDVLAAVGAAQRAGVAAVGAGTNAADVDAACRQSLSDAGYGELFVHSAGHGVGLEIHEAPWAAAGSVDILRPGSIVTVEPGAYLHGRGGVRIEDTVVVTADGARVLTKMTKDYVL